MQKKYRSFVFKKAATVAGVLLSGAVLVFGQAQQVNLTAGPASVTLPDGNTVPMWGYNCTPLAAGVTSTATCAALSKSSGGWSPVLITVPTGSDLQINLTNSLSFSNGNKVPTSIMIVGQLGGGLGDATQRTTTPSPTHAQQQTTWSTVGVKDSNGHPLTNNPPPQGARVQSFSTEVPAGATTALTWTAPRPGTYLLESGTHPGIQVPMGLIGMLVVTNAPTADSTGKETAAGTAYAKISYDAEVPLLFSEIDPVQNNAVSTAVNTAGFSETKVWSGQPNGCGNPSSQSYNTCYPPIVNYRPLYYLINGQGFDKTNASNSLFATSPALIASPPATGTGNVLVRLVNAGLKMHVPAIVGSQTTVTSSAGSNTANGFSLIAEDGNVLPGVPRVQSEVFMSAGKTYDVMINGTASGDPALPIYDRELSLSGNSINRDAGMLAYIGVNGAGAPSAPAIGAAKANPDTYNSIVPGNTLTVSDPSKGVIANDVNVYGVKVTTQPTQGTLTLNTDGTFVYAANTSWANSDSFVYCGNGTASGPACATVTLGPASVESASGITVNNIAYTANTATYIAIKTPGVLSVDADAKGFPLKVLAKSVTPQSGLTVYMDVNGGFTATSPGPGTYTFTYQAQNSQGTTSSAATVTLNFPAGSGLKVSVVDAASKAPIADYRWVIEEDRTFYVNPNCTTNTANPPAGCPTASKGANGTTVPPTFGVNFHTSHMPFVAQGCTGAKSCESGQTVLGVASVCDVSTGVCRPGTQKTAVDPSQVVLDPNKRYYISVLPGDAADPFYGANAVGHTMSGAPIATNLNNGNPVTVLAEATPLPTGKLSVMVFEDDFPLNGEQDSGG
ncbi:MAG: hypothetical protein JOZ43_07980, partial [Acidobacteriales bacterium]|nr:hypothetical protein [Terriglobales bacterium]